MGKKKEFIDPIADKSDIGFLEFALKVLYQRERNDLAQALLERFGSVPGIFRATRAELMSVPGITERVALFFTFGFSLRRQAILRELSTQPLNSEYTLTRFCDTFFCNDNEPTEACLYLDDEGRLIEAKRITSKEPAREMIVTACRIDARTIVRLGFAPSEELRPLVQPEDFSDYILTLQMTGVHLMDCIVFSPPEFFSLLRYRNSGEGYVPLENASVTPYEIPYSDAVAPPEP